jgi:hypothetical protein
MAISSTEDGLPVFRSEYSFGHGESSGTGVFSIVPRTAQGCSFRFVPFRFSLLLRSMLTRKHGTLNREQLVLGEVEMTNAEIDRKMSTLRYVSG